MPRSCAAALAIALGAFALLFGISAQRAVAAPGLVATATCSASPGSTTTTWGKGKVSAVEFVWMDASDHIIDDITDTDLKNHQASEPTPPGAVTATLTFFDVHGDPFIGAFLPSCQ